jgi:hypothetical protein
MRNRLIALAAILSIAALAASPLANASGDTTGGGGVSSGSGGSGSGGGGGGGARGGGGGGGGHFGGGGGGHFSGGGGVGMRVGGFGGGFRAGGYVGGAGSAASFVSHGFYAPERGYGMVGSEAGGFSHLGAVPRGDHAAANFAALGPRFGSAARAAPFAPRFASAARATEFARISRVTSRLAPVRPGHHPHPPSRPSVMKHHLPPVNNVSCENELCGQVEVAPFCLVPRPEELGNPNYIPSPFDCPESLRVSEPLGKRAR